MNVALCFENCHDFGEINLAGDVCPSSVVGRWVDRRADWNGFETRSLDARTDTGAAVERKHQSITHTLLATNMAVVDELSLCFSLSFFAYP
jgi:hypothetical protein